jgi:hypothetical protein
MQNELPDTQHRDVQHDDRKRKPRRFQIERLEERIAPVPGIGGGGSAGGGMYNNPFIDGDSPPPS